MASAQGPNCKKFHNWCLNLYNVKKKKKSFSCTFNQKLKKKKAIVVGTGGKLKNNSNEHGRAYPFQAYLVLKDQD